MDPEPTQAAASALAIVRVWREPGATQVRARITFVDDPESAAPATREWTGEGAAAVRDAVAAWLEQR